MLFTFLILIQNQFSNKTKKQIEQNSSNLFVWTQNKNSANQLSNNNKKKTHQNKTKQKNYVCVCVCVACYCLPIISSLSTSSTGVIFVSASTGFGIVSIFSTSIWASSIGDNPNSPQKLIFFYIHFIFQIKKIPFLFFPLKMTNICFYICVLHWLRLQTIYLKIISSTLSNSIFSRPVSIFTFN